MNPIRQFIKKTIPAVIPQRLFLSHGTPVRDSSYTPEQSSQSNTLPKVQVSFTFDDGPHPEYTPQLLDLLKEYHHRATFFVIGNKAQQYPDLIERIINEGHEIGNHTFTHSEPSETSTRQFLEEIKQTDELLKEIIGYTPELVRPPKGKLTIRKIVGLWMQRRTVVLWNRDPRDYLMTDDAEMSSWCEKYNPMPGDFCLMHDNHRFAADAVKQLSEKSQTQIQSHIISHWLEHKSYQSIINQRAHA